LAPLDRHTPDFVHTCPDSTRSRATQPSARLRSRCKTDAQLSS
jgi:hypothetical protein